MNRLTAQQLDPSSIHFVRNHPTRRRTAPRPHACYTDPTSADREQAITNFSLQAMQAEPAYPSLAYTSAVGYSAVVLPTLEFGDVKIPTNYKAAMTSPQATYWREALNKEYEGLMAMNTWETIKKDDVPQDATLLNCHVVWALKKKGSGEIEKFKARLVATTVCLQRS